MPDTFHTLSFLAHQRSADQTVPYSSLCSYTQSAGEHEQYQAIKMALLINVGKTTSEGNHICEQSQRCPLIAWCNNNSSNNNNNE